MNVSVVGLGKLGACYAAFCASKGMNVIGTDVAKRNVDALNAGRAPVSETGLAAYIKKHKKRLRATMSTEEAVLASDITLIVVPTPSNKDGSFSCRYVTAACKSIGRALAKKKEYHLVVLVSTVLPGDSRARIIPALTRYSGKVCGKDFGYSYSPSLIALGDILHNLEEPDFLFLGASDEKADRAMTAFFRALYPAREPEHMSMESAELAKISLNAYITMKITFANILGAMSERIPHADAYEITRAIGKDRRIGPHYFKSGLGYGGPCFPRDNYAFARVARAIGLKAPIALAVHRTNAAMPSAVAALLERIAKERRATRIGFLGVSYKPRTCLTDESQALAIARAMIKKGRAVTIYEPLGTAEAQKALGRTASYASSLKDLIEACDIIFVSNPDRLFASLPRLIGNRPRAVVDPWGMFESSAFKKGVQYRVIGRTQSA